MQNKSSARPIVALVCGGIIAASAGAWAQVPPAAAQADTAPTFLYEVPAGPLASALNRVADMAGLSLVYSASLAEGLRTRGLAGRYTAQEAFSILLSGTGLTFQLARGNIVRIEKAPERGTRMLGPVRVEGARSSAVNGVNGSRDVTATEGTGSFTSNALTIGSKMPLSMKETPQSVSVITAQRMEEQNITDFTEAMNRSTGITLVQGATSLENTFYSRGYAITTIQVDGGVPLSLGYGVTGTDFNGFLPQIDMAMYDHVELLRGAAGLFNGYGNPSGTVNLARKKPLDHRAVKLDTQLGSWSTRRATLDATAPLGFDAKLRGRAVVSYQDNEYFYDIAEDDKTLIYGVLEYDVTPATLVSVGSSYTRQDSVPWSAGLPRYQNGDDLQLPRGVALVFPWNYWNLRTAEAFAQAEQRIGERWTAKLNVSRTSQASSRKIGYSTGTVNPLTNAGPTMQGTMNEYGSTQVLGEVTVAGSFDVLGQQQKIVLGFNRSGTSSGGRRGDYRNPVSHSTASPYVPYPGAPAGIPLIDVFHFDPLHPLYTEPRDSLPETRYLRRGDNQTGAYVNLNLTAFDRWHLVTGVRYSRIETESVSEDLCINTTSAACIGKQVGDSMSAPEVGFNHSGHNLSWPPSVSLIFDVNDTVSTYVGYTDIYRSQAIYLDADLNPIEPITGANYEAGVKWQGRGGRVNASLAAYRMEQEGFRTTDNSRRVRMPDGTFYFFDNFGNQYWSGNLPDGTHQCCSVLDSDRGQLSRGVDLEVTGEILPRWQLSAGYTWNRSEYTGASNGDNEGEPLVSRQPEHLMKLWTSYRFKGRPWIDRLTIAGGVNAQSSAYVAGTSCTELNPPNPTTGISSCKTTVPYDFTQKAYAVWSARADYGLNDVWNVALTVDNLTDERYYRTMGTATQGNWYGAPRSFMLSVNGKFR